MTFVEVLTECVHTPELVQAFNRLNGSSLGVDNRQPIIRMIDETTGYQKEIDKQQQEWMHQFAVFVFNCIWCPLAIGAVGNAKP